MIKKPLVEKAALATLDSESLREALPGFKNIIKTLVEQGEVMFPAVSRQNGKPELERHLDSFSFIRFDGTVAELVGVIQYSFDLQAFLKSNAFIAYASAQSKLLDDEIRRKQEEIIAARYESTDLKELIAESFNASWQNRPVELLSREELKQARMAKYAEQAGLTRRTELLHV